MVCGTSSPKYSVQAQTDILRVDIAGCTNGRRQRLDIVRARIHADGVSTDDMDHVVDVGVLGAVVDGSNQIWQRVQMMCDLFDSNSVSCQLPVQTVRSRQSSIVGMVLV